MAAKRKLSGAGISVPALIGIGVIVSIAVMLIGALVLAYLVMNVTVGIESIGIGAVLIVFLSSAAGCWLVSKLAKQKKPLVSGLTALAFYLVLLSITTVFFDGAFAQMGITALLVLLGAGVSLLPNIRRKPGKSKIKIPAYR